MSKAIEQRGSLTVGHVGFGLYGQAPGSPRRQVHDGDTINVRALGNINIRFLGIDAPEISFAFREHPQNFIPLEDSSWETYLSDPFAANLPPFEVPLSSGLLDALRPRLGPGTATNHAQHAQAAREALIEEIRTDMEVLGQSEDTFEFFLAFAYEIMDRYGRLLCYVNRNQPQEQTPVPRPRSYNERLLQVGWVSPYFIWPNVDPFRRLPSIAAAVLEPGTAADVASGHNALADAGRDVRAAREQGKGIFQQANPLRLAAFELRYLARRTAPDRWVIDLSKKDNVLLKPMNYYTIPYAEDRLFIPEEYVPLFVEKGWQRQTE
ncbi:MAG: hypothetical protein IMW89_18080 [Ktedonobacteraceae bacterium]|nr:hypothetical protein [Ktedonobacteraceae bacterium]